MVNVVEPSVELLWITPDAEKKIEQVARTCYKSEDKICEGSAEKIINKLMNSKHYAMLEFPDACIKFITDRSITHEIVRHRVASYAQESTRYCNYSKNKFDGEITVIEPTEIKEIATTRNRDIYKIWWDSMVISEKTYFKLLELKASPQTARSVLPLCLKTEINMKANFREWLHFFDLRLSPKAHPDMRVIAQMAYNLFHKECPIIFPNRCGNGKRVETENI